MNNAPVVLIVDDDVILCEMIKRILAGEGYTLVAADNGQQALQQAAALLPDLVLLDVMMPGIDGFEVCRRLRADPRLAEVPVIMLTALSDRAACLRAFELGADDFVSKPFDSTELRARVRNVVRLNRFRRLLEERQRADLLEEEQRQLAYDLHDTVAQAVTGVHQRLQAFAYLYPPALPAGRQELDAILAMAQAAAREIPRLLARIPWRDVETVGLSTALRMLADEFQARGLEVLLRDDLEDERMPPPVETALFKVAREALTNVIKHAGTAQVALTLQRTAAAIRLEVRDQGCGFDLPFVASRTRWGAGGLGLRSMRQRAQFAGGTLEIRTAPGAGTSVVVELPVPPEPRSQA